MVLFTNFSSSSRCSRALPKLPRLTSRLLRWCWSPFRGLQPGDWCRWHWSCINRTSVLMQHTCLICGLICYSAATVIWQMNIESTLEVPTGLEPCSFSVPFQHVTTSAVSPPPWRKMYPGIFSNKSAYLVKWECFGQSYRIFKNNFFSLDQ